MRRPRAQQLDKHKRNSRWFAATLCVCLVVLTWVVFGQTLRHEFVNYDDQEYVYQNKRITSGLSLENFCWAFTHAHSGNWHPLTTISHMLDCQFYGLKPAGHHLSNVEPENAETRNIFGTILVQKGRVAEAISQWQNALGVDPENGNAKSNLAWILATCPDARVRNDSRAVALAEDAVHLSGGNNPILLCTLAAAYAEAGRFLEAIHAAQSGFELATSQHNCALADEFQRNIALTNLGRPCATAA